MIADQYPHFSALHIGTASVSLAFLGALVGSLSRPYGGRLADRFGGAKITIGAFAVMALVVVTVVAVLPSASFWVFLALFLVLFAASGIGNGSTYRMIPTVFAWRGGTADAHRSAGDIGSQRKAAAALGIISAIGAYGGFVIPQALGLSKTATGSYQAGLLCFVGAYVIMAAITYGVYLRSGRRSGLVI